MQAAPQTLEDALLNLAGNWQPIVAAMVLITLSSLLIGYLLLKFKRAGWAHAFMSLPIFITTIPGIFFCLVLAYLFFLTKANLLSLPLFYFFPPIWMAISLYLFSNLVEFDLVPGFDRLSGLVLLAAIAFAFVFILFKMQFVSIVWFRPMHLLVLVLLLYLGGRLALKRIFRQN